jgi:cell division protein FtsB
MQTVQSHAICVEQSIATLITAVDGCRGTLLLMQKDLVESENCLQYHMEQSRQYHQANLSLQHERDQMTREINRLRSDLAVEKRESQHLNQVNEMLQKRLYELGMIHNDHILVSG